MKELNKIYLQDCVSGMSEMDTESIDLIVTSPPYNAGIDYANYSDNLSWSEYYLWSEKWIQAAYQVLKPDGRLCINHFLNFGDKDNRNSPIMELNRIAQIIGFRHHGVALWTDNNITKRTAWGSWLSASAPYVNLSTEAVLILYKNVWKKQRVGVSDITKEEFMEATSGRWNIQPEGKQLTKACFPIALPLRCIKLFSYVGDTILDPFMGSGTTALASVQSKRNFIGFELSQEYIDTANKRLEQKILTEVMVGDSSPT